MEFDPYTEWLSIAPQSRPPNHYELLGLALFEEDGDAINDAYESRTTEIRKFQAGQRSEEALRILDELADAYVCLTDETKRQTYDDGLIPASPPITTLPPAVNKHIDAPPRQIDTENAPAADEPPQTEVRTRSIWAIDIDSFALKAIRLYFDPIQQRVTASGYEYIEHEMPLANSQGNRAATLITTLNIFVRRTASRGERVAVMLPGQSMSSLFVKFPIVDSKELPGMIYDIAEMELPAELPELEWSYQAVSGRDAGGFVVNAEFGIFGVARDAISRTLEPFDKAGLDISQIQFRPLALHNFAVHELGLNSVDPRVFDFENPPPWTCLLNLDAVETEVVLTNGCQIWRESISMGTNDFSSAISVQLEIRFAEAEALRRDPSRHGDVGQVFDAIEYVYRDYVAKVRIPLAQFKVVYPDSQIERIVLLGTGIDRMGLEAYLSRELETETELLDAFNQLEGEGIKKSPGFRQHLSSFAACYGLGLQALELARLRVNLLPDERKRSAAGAGMANIVGRWNRVIDWLTDRRNRTIFNLFVIGALTLIIVLAMGCFYLLNM